MNLSVLTTSVSAFRVSVLAVIVLSVLHAPLVQVDVGVYLSPLRLMILLSASLLFGYAACGATFPSSCGRLLFALCAAGSVIFVSSLSAFDYPLQLRAVAHYVFGVIISFVVACYVITEDKKDAVFVALTASLCLLLLLASWEMFTGNHLSYSKLATGEGGRPFYASGTYFNRNDLSYAFNLCSGILLSLLFARSLRKRNAYVIAVVLACTTGVFAVNGSNAAILAMAFQLAFFSWFVFCAKRKNIVLRRLLGLSIALVLVAQIVVFGGLFEYFSRLDVGGVRGGSPTVRANIALCAWEMLTERNFVGVGPGNSGEAIGTCGYYTRGVVDPHSLIVEVVLETGIVLIAPVVLWCMASLFLRVNEARIWSLPQTKLSVWVLAVTIVVGSLGPSSALGMPLNWVAIGFLGAFLVKNKKVGVKGSGASISKRGNG